MTRPRVAAGRLVLAIALGALVLSGCARAVSSARMAAADDATVTTRVKTVFINDVLVGGETIDVETVAGVVTLSGTVHSKEQEVRAIELARTVRGVTDVKSALLIQP